MKKFLLFLFIIICSYTSLRAQKESVYLSIVSEHKINYKQVHDDSISVVRQLNEVINYFHNSAYLTASFDQFVYGGDTLTAYLNTGPVFEWAMLSEGNIPPAILYKSGYKEKFYRNSLFNYKDFLKLKHKIIGYSENVGYPFASVKLDSITIEDKSIAASIYYQKGPLIVFDTLHLLGESTIKPDFLAKYLKIIEGQPYSQEKVDRITRVLKELPYLKQTRPPVVTFRGNKAQVGLFLEDRKINQIDGILGFLPNEAEGGKMLLTGEVNLNLKNLFGSGKNLQLEWRRFMQASQLLDVDYYHPRLLGSAVDVEGGLNLFKQDSSFINIDRSLAFHHNLNNNGRISFFSGLATSRVLSGYPWTDTTKLPPLIDFDYIKYGAGYSWNNLDDLFYPHQGWMFTATGIIGNKNIRPNALLNERLYDDIQLRSVQLVFNSQIHKFIPVGKKGVVWLRGEGGKIFNNADNIFLNDLFRIGGLKSLRGFNENNFYASGYGIGTIEYRFFTEETSYFLLFFDQGYIVNQFHPNFPSDFPRSFGAGVSFASGPGIFNFVYSMGMSKAQPLNLNLSKIHFGFVSRF
ncbi:MAG: BamA/TamA family outer membrane protein [Cytophagaceae bacterium]